MQPCTPRRELLNISSLRRRGAGVVFSCWRHVFSHASCVVRPRRSCDEQRLYCVDIVRCNNSCWIFINKMKSSSLSSSVFLAVFLLHLQRACKIVFNFSLFYLYRSPSFGLKYTLEQWRDEVCEMLMISSPDWADHRHTLKRVKRGHTTIIVRL